LATVNFAPDPLAVHIDHLEALSCPHRVVSGLWKNLEVPQQEPRQGDEVARGMIPLSPDEMNHVIERDRRVHEV